MNIQTNLRLERYSDNELLVLLDHGILSVTEYETEMANRNAQAAKDGEAVRYNKRKDGRYE